MALIPNRHRLEAAALNDAAVRQPARRPGSIRRTSSLQSLWSPGEAEHFRIVGRARDLVTVPDGHLLVIGEDHIDVEIDGHGRIAAIGGSPSSERLRQFTGLRAGGDLRKAVARDMPEEERAETRLHRLLDDLAGAVFMSVAAWYAWDGGIGGHAARTNSPARTERTVAGVCLSYVPGSPAMSEDGRGLDENADHPLGPPPLSADDPDGFHALVETDHPNEWRLRRTDIWRSAGELVVDAWFQDSSGVQGDRTRRVIFHEYGLVARVDPATLAINAISVTPHVLPYVTCRAAQATADVLVGRNVGELRHLVLALLKGTAGCTHLNDMLRALQDVKGMACALADLTGTRQGGGAARSSAD